MSNAQKDSSKVKTHLRRAAVITLVVSVVIGLVFVVRWYVIHKPVLRFGVVVPGVLYRSGQPDESGWRFLRDKIGIRTVIDLRENAPHERWSVLEREFCARNGIRHIKMPVGHQGLTEKQLRTLIETVSDPRCQPVLVHCKLGRSRTGIAVAAYRVVVQGWSYQKALADSHRYKGHMNRPYRAYLKRLSQG